MASGKNSFYIALYIATSLLFKKFTLYGKSINSLHKHYVHNALNYSKGLHSLRSAPIKTSPKRL